MEMLLFKVKQKWDKWIMYQSMWINKAIIIKIYKIL